MNYLLHFLYTSEGVALSPVLSKLEETLYHGVHIITSKHHLHKLLHGGSHNWNRKHFEQSGSESGTKSTGQLP